MQITIDLDDELVRNFILQVVQSQFEYRLGEPEGMKMLKKQVIEQVKSIDLSIPIRNVANAQLHGIVDQVVSTTLKDAVRQKAKQMQKEGMLFNEG